MILSIAIILFMLFALFSALKDGGPGISDQEQQDFDEGYKAGSLGGPVNPDNERYMEGFAAGQYDNEHENK